MAEYLSDSSAPHKVQHALAQLSNRIARGDKTATRWYPEIIALAHDKEPQLRSMAAWTMGQDNRSSEFQKVLRGLVTDPAPLVRWNAALALARFGDAAGEPQLRAMLDPFTLTAPHAGTIKLRLEPPDAVESGDIVARLTSGSNAEPVEIISPLAGKIARLSAKDGETIAAGDHIAMIEPAESQVIEALRALALVGHAESLAAAERYAAAVPGVSDRVRRQALLTAQSIRQRPTQNEPSK